MKQMNREGFPYGRVSSSKGRRDNGNGGPPLGSLRRYGSFLLKASMEAEFEGEGFMRNRRFDII